MIDKVKFTPVRQTDGRRTYEFRAEPTLGRVIAAIAQALSVPEDAPDNRRLLQPLPGRIVPYQSTAAPMRP